MDVFHRNLRSRKNVLGFTTDMSTEVDHGSTSDLLLLAERSVLHMLFLFFFRLETWDSAPSGVVSSHVVFLQAWYKLFRGTGDFLFWGLLS